MDEKCTQNSVEQSQGAKQLGNQPQEEEQQLKPI
jgi:hypothetical protein